MPLADALLQEFTYEAANTRKVLERVPDDKLDWRPHPKSFTMGQLATHVARLSGWGLAALASESYDLDPNEGPGKAAESRAERLAFFDEGVANFAAALKNVTDEQFMQTWTLTAGGRQIFALPRIGVLRSMIFNHLVHHRAQLGMYLRLNGIPVPSIYGPTADESLK